MLSRHPVLRSLSRFAVSVCAVLLLRPSVFADPPDELVEKAKRIVSQMSDQENTSRWMTFEPMSDEFEGDKLDAAKWTVGMYWWKGRQPALFSEKNVTVSGGKLHLTTRKEKVPEEFEKRGYKDYTSAALYTKVRSGYAPRRRGGPIQHAGRLAAGK